MNIVLGFTLLKWSVISPFFKQKKSTGYFLKYNKSARGGKSSLSLSPTQNFQNKDIRLSIP